MRYTETDHGHYVLRFEEGESFPARLVEFLGIKSIAAGSFTGLGAMFGSTIAFFNVETCAYEDIELREQLEVVSLVGNVALYEGRPLVHAHVALGRRNGQVVGGHLQHGIVRPTLEVYLSTLDRALERKVDPKYGLPALDLTEKLD